MKELLMEEMLGFGQSNETLALYVALREAVFKRWPDSNIVVHKTQVNFQDPRPYLWVSLPGQPISGKVAGRLTLSFMADTPVDSPRILNYSEPYPGRFTHHLYLHKCEEIDEELMAWVAFSRAFRNQKPPTKGGKK